MPQILADRDELARTLERAGEPLFQTRDLLARRGDLGFELMLADVFRRGGP